MTSARLPKFFLHWNPWKRKRGIEMLTAFKRFIESEKLCRSGDRIVLAVSGGADSVVMADLFAAAGYFAVVAHVNHKLRETESDQDEEFARQLAARYGWPFEARALSGAELNADSSQSIQSAARDLRYQWFEEIRRHYNCNWVATAHHADDSFETLMINLLRGTSLSGLKGIPSKRDNIIRPLLFATREQILSYTLEKNLEFRHDSSNDEDKYERNRIRHHLIPEMRRINPALNTTAQRTIENLRAAWYFYNLQLTGLRKKLLLKKGDDYLIPFRKVITYEFPAHLLFELINPFGFNFSQATDILFTPGHSGRNFTSPG